MDKKLQDLIRKTAEGDKKAFEEVYRMLAQDMYRVAYRMLGNKEDAQDMVSLVFVKLYEDIKKFRFESDFRTYSYRIVVNGCISLLRKKKMFRLIDKIFHKERENEIEKKDLVEYLLQRIPEKSRVVIILREMQGFSYEEIAKILQVGVNTVKSRIHRARKMLVDAYNDLKKMEDWDGKR